MLEGYFLRQTFVPLVASVGALGLLALLVESLSTLELIIDQRQTVLVYLQITLLALPQLMALVLPLALFVAALYTINRLQGDSEIVVCSAAGMSRSDIARPVIKLGVAALIINLAMNVWVQPATFRVMREKLFEVRGDFVAKLVRPGEFRTPTEGLTFYTRDIDGGRLYDLLIHDARDEARPATYMAKSGRFAELAGEPALIMYEGSVQTVEPDHTLTFLKFDSFPLELTPIIGTEGGLFYKLSDRYLSELLFPRFEDLWDYRNRNELWAEGHYRLSAPFYNLALVFIALAGVLGGQFSRIGQGRRIAVAAACALGVRLLGFTAQSAAADAPLLNVLQYAVPIVACVWAAQIMSAKPFIRAGGRRVTEGRPA